MLWAGVLYTITLYLLMPYFAWPLYLAFFLGLWWLAERHSIPRVTAISLAIYATYAISELWELPIHAVSWQTDPLLGISLSAFKLLGVPLFFYTLRKELRWAPNHLWILSLAPAIMWAPFIFTFTSLNLAAYPLADANPLAHELITNNLNLLHWYRLPFLMIFATAILTVKKGPAAPPDLINELYQDHPPNP